MKGILTRPVTILQWLFVRNDQPRQETFFQIALALRRQEWKTYLRWMMDADVISIEISRSKMERLADFARFRYPNAIEPGVYDI